MSVEPNNDRLTARIIELIRSEAVKDENRAKLRCVVDPVISHVGKCITPYVTLTLVIFTLILLCQGYLVYKLWKMQTLQQI